jgi:ribonucleotide reductase beta subunit family protein with ferritin-like domain
VRRFITYIEFVADRLMVQLGFDKVYGAHSRLASWSGFRSRTRTNFFEGRVSEYLASSVNLTTVTTTMTTF